MRLEPHDNCKQTRAGADETTPGRVCRPDDVEDGWDAVDDNYGGDFVFCVMTAMVWMIMDGGDDDDGY
eukprot:2824953-Pyramimonas_sp.AAC.1